jgi:hypothetical protein
MAVRCAAHSHLRADFIIIILIIYYVGHWNNIVSGKIFFLSQLVSCYVVLSLVYIKTNKANRKLLQKINEHRSRQSGPTPRHRNGEIAGIYYSKLLLLLISYSWRI